MRNFFQTKHYTCFSHLRGLTLMKFFCILGRMFISFTTIEVCVDFVMSEYIEHQNASENILAEILVFLRPL